MPWFLQGMTHAAYVALGRPTILKQRMKVSKAKKQMKTLDSTN